MAYTALKNAILSEKIDWIAYSQALNLEWDFPDYIDSHWKDIRVPKFYTHAQENKQGVKRFWNVENLKQGRSVVLAGVASGILRENQFNFLQWVSTTKRKATRIDYAIDITHSSFRTSMVRRHLKAGEAVTHALSALQTGDIFLEGDTQYVGRKGSETYTRVYDKKAEMGADFSWTRIETVYQGERAKPSLEAYCKGASCGQLIRRHVDFPEWEDWNRIMVNPRAEVHIPSHISRTREWLLGTVAKSMAREISLDDDHTFWFDFIERVKAEISLIDIGGGIINF